MENKKRICFLIIAIIVFIFLCVVTYRNIISVKRSNNIFSKEMERIAEENKKTTFEIQKVVLYSSAEYEDLSPEQNLQDISIHQYTDIAIYISNDKTQDGSMKAKNTEYELTEANTVSQLYIDEIKVESKKDIGIKLFNYKNPLDVGKYRTIEESVERIDFDIIHKNEENTEDYSKPSFFTDCSNPITVGMLNKNVLEHCTASNDGTLELNGTILKNAGVNLNDLRTKISFKVHLKNNLNEEFICNVVIENDLGNGTDTIYDGYLLKVLSEDDLNLRFFKKP